MAPGPEAFDALGNRQGGSCNVASRDSGQRAVNFVRRDNGLNQYAHWWPAGRDYGVYYDDNFNQDWQFPGNGVTMGDGWLAASYDALNRPVAMWSFTYQGTPNVLWFGFDPLGRCVKRWVSGNGVDFYINPATYFNYEGWNLLQEGGNAWGPSRVYVQGNRVDEIVWSYKTATGEQAFHHYDARGHCTLLTDSSANIAEQYEYDAFGHASREQKPVAELGVALPLIEQIVRQGLHSDGNNPEGSHNYSHASVTNYVASQSTLRHQVAVILKTTPEQEKKINQYMDARANKTVDKFNDNCARRVSGALKEAGLGFKSTPIPETVVDHARSTGGAQYGIPKGAPQLGPNLKSFDPRMPTQPPVPELLHR